MERIYTYNCTNPDDTEELEYICDNHIDITYNTFIKNVNPDSFKELCSSLGYDKHLHIKNDYAASFRRSKYKGKYIYFVVHSAIEYVFKMEGN